MTKVSLIMPVRNEAGSVTRTMDSVFAQTRLPDEIVIGDGCSTDGTLDLILTYSGRGIPIRVQRETAGRVAAGRNVAIAAAQHDIIAAADFGNVLDTRWLEEIVKPLESDGKVDMVAGLAWPAQATTRFGQCVVALAQPGRLVDVATRPLPKTIIAGGASVAFRRSIWERAGGFPEWIKAAEDKLFCRKVHLIGGKVAGTVAAVAYKEQRSDLWAFIRQHYDYGKGNAQSRQVSRNTARLSIRYLSGLILLAAGFAQPVAWVLLVAAIAVHVWRSAMRPFRAAGTRLDVGTIALAPVVLASRNLAWIAGHGAGYADWLLNPSYKAQYRKYMAPDGMREGKRNNGRAEASDGLAVVAIGLTKRYPHQRGLTDLMAGRHRPETTALEDVTLTIGQGEVFGLLGPNGSGKTTCLKLLSTILTPSAGTATIFGHDIRRDARTVRGLVALVSGEERSLYWRLTARQNLEFFGRLYGLDAKALRRKIAELLDVFDLTHVADIRAAEYSTGMRQKLAIARGLLSSPKLLFLDEPTRGLDPVAAHNLLHVVKDRAVEHFDNTVVLTTHIAREVEQLCRRIAILNRGTIGYEGTVDNLRASLERCDTYLLTVEHLSSHTFEGLRNRMGEACRRLTSTNSHVNLELRFTTPGLTLTDVLRQLIMNGVDIVQCTKREASFEEMFRTVFNRGVSGLNANSTDTTSDASRESGCAQSS